ncbi:hypothetical protein BKA62DRAFT_713007 [Auriculariales sp. MPI-PUGE-AT-0066]|nr:hypothetical protein BKA62DRAFT_713007 [Auriculariales sp. MPI-PUGE-AT-0066]
MEKMATKYGKHLFEKNLEHYTPKDPLYEDYVDDRGKKRRRAREVPPGLSKRDEKILRSVKKRAHYLDKGFSICGLRFGWTFIIGFIPIVGDFADVFLNYMLVVRKAKKAELPDWLVRRMLVNNAISATIGFVPFVGDVMLAAYKANSRNAWLLDEFLRIRGEELLKATIARVEDPAVVRPGAGLESGEKIPGKTAGALKSLGSLWKSKATEDAAASGSTSAPTGAKSKETV